MLFQIELDSRRGMSITQGWRILGCVAALVSMFTVICEANDKDRLPNIIVILADDMGYGDAGCYGSTALKTPHLDQLAKRGVRFTDFHSSGNVCSPTRAGLMTGRYQDRAGLAAVVNADPKISAHHGGLQPQEFTFAEALKARGYATALIGKWHLGYDKKYNPTHQGFDRFRGFVSGNIDYISHYDRMGVYDWWDGVKQVKEEGYSTHLITKHAVNFMEENKSRPFCLYVAHEAVHSPFQGPNDPAIRGPAAKRGAAHSTREEALRAMMTAMDDGVGQIVAKVEALGLTDSTFIFFFSDNGPAAGSAGPLRGKKGSNWEGGHRVPAIACWPGKIKAGVVTDELAISLDLMPTMLELTGAKPAPDRKLDGISLVPLLLLGESLGQRQLFWNHRAMRHGKWKLIIGGKRTRQNAVRLYDLEAEIGEQTNLASKYPGRVDAMQKALKAWSAEVASNVTPQPDVASFDNKTSDSRKKPRKTTRRE